MEFEFGQMIGQAVGTGGAAWLGIRWALNGIAKDVKELRQDRDEDRDKLDYIRDKVRDIYSKVGS